MTEEQDDKQEAGAAAEKKPEAPAQHEPIDPELAREALANLQSMVRGNGIRPDSLKLASFSGEVLNFEAQNVFRIIPVVSERHTTGRENGERVGSAQDARQKVQATIDRLARDRDVHKLTASILKKRGDLGFAIKEQTIALRRYKKAFVVHEPCGPCDATGKTLCQNCHGKRMIMCVKCHGQRDIQCHACNGAQFIVTPQGRQQCTLCYGNGRIGCDMCQQTGEVICPKCRNTGKMPCKRCGNTGWHSHSFHMEVNAKSRFAYDSASLPEEVPPLIDAYGPALVTDGHAHVHIAEDLRRQQELEKTAQTGEYILPYDVKLPWGEVHFTVADKNRLDARLFGFTPALLELPHFLEKIMGGALRHIGDAARGRGNVAASISKATRFRAIGDAFLAVSRGSPKQAAGLLRKRYPCGFAAATLDKLALDARQAMNNVAKKPRLTGLAAGAGLTALLYAAYFFGPQRIATLEKNTGIPELALDFGLLLLGGLIMAAGARLGVGHALKKALGPVLERSGEKSSKIMPRAGESALIAFPAALALFALILFLGVSTGHIPPPTWYSRIAGGP